MPKSAHLVQDVQNGRTIGWLQCETLRVPCTRKKSLQRKTTKDYYYIGVQENIGMFSSGGGVSELMDRRGCAILALELVPKNLIFT